MKKVMLVLLIIIILLSVGVSASQYNFTRDDSELKHTNILTGNYQIGRMLFNKVLQNQTKFYLNNLTNMNLNIGDGICNNETSTFDNTTNITTSANSWNIVGTAILSPGGCREFPDVATLNVINTGTNATAVWYVTLPTYPTISFSTTDSQFPLTFSANNFVVNTLTEVFINITTPINLLQNSYTDTFKINGIPYTYNFSVGQFLLWNSNMTLTSTNLNALTTGTLGNIGISNIGNSFSTLTANVTGAITDFVSFTPIILSYSGTTLAIPITYNVKENQRPGNYNGSITIYDSTKSITYNLSINIVDTIKPEIYNITTADNFQATRPFQYSLKARDNNNLSSVSLQIFETTTQIYSVNYTPQDLYVFNITLPKVMVYSGKLIATDTSGNSQVMDLAFSVGKLDAFHWDANVLMKKKKYSFDKGQDILWTDNPSALTIKLIAIDTNLSLIKFSTDKESFNLKDINQTINFASINGNLTLTIKNEKPVDYAMTIELIPNDIEKPLGIVTISGQLINYSIPEKFCDDWFGGQICCDYENVDNYDNMTTKCLVTKKGALEKSEIGVPMTIQDRRNFEKSWTDQIANWQGKNFTKTLWLIVFVSLVVILFLLLLYIIGVRPHKVVLRGFNKSKDG